MMLGNLTIARMEDRLDIKFPDELIAYMDTCHQEKANDIAVGKWHCFDLPFTLVCGDKATAEKIAGYLSPLGDKMKGSISISWVN